MIAAIAGDDQPAPDADRRPGSDRCALLEQQVEDRPHQHEQADAEQAAERFGAELDRPDRVVATGRPATPSG